MRKLFKLFGGIGAFALVAGLAIGAYAFTNTLTVTGNGTGGTVQAAYGPQTAAILSAGSIHFTPDATNPTEWDSVVFTLNQSVGSGGTVSVTYDGTTYLKSFGTSPACSSTDFTTWTCDVSSSPVAFSAVNDFNVTAAQ